MRHVLVETNWVVDYAAPPHRRRPEAIDLLKRAAAGELKLYAPSISLTEARFTIQRKFEPRSEVDAMRGFLAWARSERKIEPDQVAEIRRVLDMFEKSVKNELKQLQARLDSLREPGNGVEVFALDHAMLERAAALGSGDIYLEPFDQAILAAVLVRGERLRAGGETDICFCELDSNLQPWGKRGGPKPELTRQYDRAGVWVYKDYTLTSPERPAGWGKRGEAQE